MKKKVFVMALTCMMALQGNAQVYQYDTWSQLPVQDIYGDMLNPSMARMMAEADARMEEAFNFYYDEARKACGQKNWTTLFIMWTRHLTQDITIVISIT